MLGHLHCNYLQAFSKKRPRNLDTLISWTASQSTHTRRQPRSHETLYSSTLNSNYNSLVNYRTTNSRYPNRIVFRRAVSTRAKLTKAEQRDALFETNSSSSSSKVYSLDTAYTPSVSLKQQTAAEGEWLQENDEEIEETPSVSKVPRSRFDWRGRATSRAKPVVLRDGERTRVKRIRPIVPLDDENDPFLPAVRNYSLKFLKLLALEEAESEAALKHRLSTWSVDLLRKEGYCMTGLSAYWLKANQFGRPVAAFILGPGIDLPESKFEKGTQVLVSRYDPLKEEPLIGSVLSRTESQIRVCFPNHFDLDEGQWRLDLGRPNLMYERMRVAVSHLRNDVQKIEDEVPRGSTEFILQGTKLRDVILRSFKIENELAAPAQEKASNLIAKNSGIFKQDQRIQSWARRYSYPNPIIMEGDPPLDGLNASQVRAMATMISERMSLIQGPPGTGKTKTIIETIKLLKVHFEVPHPILVCTYTNVAVDNLVEGFAQAGVKPLRVGYNGIVREPLLQHSLDYKLQQHPLHRPLTASVGEESKITPAIQKLLKDCEDLDAKLEASVRPRKSTLQRVDNMKKAIIHLGERQAFLKRKIYAMQQDMLKDVIEAADVICTTCITSACQALNAADFPVVFIDEASMSTEPSSLIPLMKGSQHVALIGDHKQLPPIIVNAQAKEGGFGVSLFERLIEEQHVPSVMLDVQYRMHPAISCFPAMEFYDLALQDGTVDSGGKALPGLEPPRSKHMTRREGKKHRPSVIFLDHTGNESFQGRSVLNLTEAHIVASIVEDLLLNNKRLRGHDIGIIAPYAAQIKLLTRMMNTDSTYRERFKAVLGDQRAMHLEHIEIKTVDGFEGREKDVIIFSTVRNNGGGNIGFLADKKRLNVGLTRAKRGLFVVGSISTLRVAKMASAGRNTAAASDEEAKTRAPVVRVGKGADSWRRYADYLTEGGLVVSLKGEKLESALYEHLYAVQGEQQEMQKAAAAQREEVKRIRIAATGR